MKPQTDCRALGRPDLQTLLVLWKDCHTDHRFIYSNDTGELELYWYCWTRGEWYGKEISQ